MTKTIITTKDGQAFRGMASGPLAYFRHPGDTWGYRLWHLPTNMGICAVFFARQARELIRLLLADPTLRWDFTDPEQATIDMKGRVKAHYTAVLNESRDRASQDRKDVSV